MRFSLTAYRLRLLACYLRRASICPGLPTTAIIATTHRCNMTCRMCIRATRAFESPDMEVDLFRKVIDEGVPYLRYISLDGPGETIMNPEAFRTIRYAKSRGLRVMFSTNATMLDRSTTDAILDSGLDLIIFSVNGVTPEVYEIVHRRSCYEAVVANIHQFLERKKQRRAPILVVVQMIRLPETLPQVKAFYRLWRRVPGVDLVRVKGDVLCSKAVWHEEIRRPHRRNPCSRLWHGPLFVETNGDVYASPGVLYRSEPVGNVQKSSLAEIWNGKRMQAMRRAHVIGDLSDCPECVDCAYPEARLPLILSGFLLDPFVVGKLIPLAERLAFWHRLPLYQRTVCKPEPDQSK